MVLVSADLQLRNLRLGAELAGGGQGRIHGLGGEPDRVVKVYHDPQSPHINGSVLTELVQLGPTLNVAGHRHEIWAAWPLARVLDGQKAVGFVMQMAPEPFWFTLGGQKRLADFSYLASRPSHLWGNVELPDEITRIRILAHLASVIATLHQFGLVAGDLSFGNILWKTKPTPGVMLIDCDGLHREGHQSVLPQADTVDWDDPLAAPATPPDRDRDNYKFALAVLRVLTQKLTARPSANEASTLNLPPHLDAGVRELLQRAAGPRGTRPTAVEWQKVLSARRTVHVLSPTQRFIQAPPANPSLIVDARPRTVRATRPVGPIG